MACRVYETYLPDELVDVHILPHLPTKSIGRFRCVSKSWRSLLSSPEFMKSHLKHHMNKPADVLLQNSYDNLKHIYMINFSSGSNRNDWVSRITHPYESDEAETHLGPSCHGLVLLKLRIDRYWDDTCHLILINPITKESLKLSANPYGEVYGLGYDSVTDDYKIISISVSCHSGITGAGVDSVKLKTWRRLSNLGCLRDLFCINDHGVFLDGYIYWIGRKKTTVGFHSVFFAFNLAREEFEQLPLPSGFEDVDCPCKITVFEGFIALAVGPGWNCLLDIWVMKEYGVQDSWINVATIPKPKSFCVIRGTDHACLLNRDEMVLYTKSKRLFRMYNWTNEDCRNVEIADLQNGDHRWLKPFRGSLLSPKLLAGKTFNIKL